MSMVPELQIYDEQKFTVHLFIYFLPVRQKESENG